jgi:hypothetical protein
VGQAAIRPARAYVDTTALRSIDFSLTKRILAAQDKAALDFLIQHLWPEALGRDPDLAEMCHQVEVIAGRGLLTRILLIEYLELGRRLYGQFPPPGVRDETREFIRFLHGIAARQPGEDLDLEFRRGNIRVGLILVGDRTVVSRLGAAPYIRRTLKYVAAGVQAVYLLGRGSRNAVVERTVGQLAGDGRVLDFSVTSYSEANNDVEATCARILFDRSAASALGLATSGRPSWRRGNRRHRQRRTTGSSGSSPGSP